VPVRLALVCLLALLLAAPAAQARGPFELGVQDDPVFVSHPNGVRGPVRYRLPRTKAFDAAKSLRAKAVRMNIVWSWVVPHATSRRTPKHITYDFSIYDLAVNESLARGLQPQLTLTGPAPAWATRNHRVGVVAPDAKKFARFAHAATEHFKDRVRRWSVWNEPNWFSLLQPVRSAPFIYRALYRGAYQAIHRADPDAQVLLGEFAPMGRRGRSIPPLQFLRAMTCRDRRLKPAGRCEGLKAEGLALHPYTLRYAPRFPGPSTDDVTTGSLDRLVRILKGLRKVRALRTPTGTTPPIYLTEYGFLARSGPFRASLAARYLKEGLQLAYRVPQVRQVVLYEMGGARPGEIPRWDSALLDYRGRARPLFRSAVAWARSRLPALRAR
jgi:hypothetical protein